MGILLSFQLCCDCFTLWWTEQVFNPVFSHIDCFQVYRSSFDVTAVSKVEIKVIKVPQRQVQCQKCSRRQTQDKMPLDFKWPFPPTKRIPFSWRISSQVVLAAVGLSSKIWAGKKQISSLILLINSMSNRSFLSTLIDQNMFVHSHMTYNRLYLS